LLILRAKTLRKGPADPGPTSDYDAIAKSRFPKAIHLSNRKNISIINIRYLKQLSRANIVQLSLHPPVCSIASLLATFEMGQYQNHLSMMSNRETHHWQHFQLF
jgi:hypothetical protein